MEHIKFDWEIVMDNSGRSIHETRENITFGNVLSYNNILSLIDAYVYGTATPMMSLIKTLRMIYSQIENGITIQFFDKSGTVRTICKDNFEPFILDYFDDFVLKEVYSEDKNGLYK